MKNIRALFFIAIAMFCATASSFGQSAKAPRTVEQQILKKIANLPNYGVFDHIAFQYNSGTVVLTGKVLSLGTKSQAENVVRSIAGVTSVENNIKNLNSGGYDDAIRYRLLREFSRNVGGGVWLGEPNPTVHIIVENGRVTLEGFVNNSGTSNTLNIIANTIPGVFQVTNNLKIGDR